MFKIKKDYLWSEGTEATAVGTTVNHMPLYGIERVMGVESDELPNEGDVVWFRLKDDDGELLYDGTLTDDPDCVNQMAALRWGETDAGATTILVKRDGEWVQEIG